MRGVIVRGISGFYTVEADNGISYTLKARGIFRRRKITPLVGDQIRFAVPENEDDAWIDEIFPRTNELIRPPVANIARLIVVIAPVPKPDLLLLDALLVNARRQRIAPTLVINKSDLDSAFCQQIRDEYRQAGCEILITSVIHGDGLQALGKLIKQGICCFAGQSGVGKSSLAAAVTGIELSTGDISGRIARGKHTTRHAELLIENGFQVLDTAGFSLLSQSEPEDPVTLKSYYPEFAPFEPLCRFQPCYHGSEPGCAVKTAAHDGKIVKERLDRYHQLLENAKEAWKGRYE
jgi:ribosome biogenesis GTPase / thiamine phosphate phosphatase